MSEEPTDPDLSLVSCDAMIDELARRSEGLIVAWERNLNGRENEFFADWRGGVTLAIGLAERLKARIVQYALDGVKPPADPTDAEE